MVASSTGVSTPFRGLGVRLGFGVVGVVVVAVLVSMDGLLVSPPDRGSVSSRRSNEIRTARSAVTTPVPGRLRRAQQAPSFLRDRR
jgi:hypothetical protein